MTEGQLLIGSYTDNGDKSGADVAGGILAARFHGTVISNASVAAELTNPSWITADADRRHVYAVIETQTYHGRPGGAVAAFSREQAGQLVLLNIQPSGGVLPAHVAVDPTDRFVVIANYQDGSVSVFPTRVDGSLGAAVHHQQHVGSGVHPLRQSGPHAHQIVFDPESARVLVPDLGADQILLYDLHDDGSLTQREDLTITTAAGSGPRHLAWHPDRHHLFVVNELNNTLSSYGRQGKAFTEIQTLSTLPPEFTGHTQAAAVRVRQAGDFVFTSNRGHNSIAMFAFDSRRGRLKMCHHEPVRGQEPRDIAITPDDETLVVANQNSNNLVTFTINLAARRLEYRATSHAAKPTCLLFL